MLDRVIANAPGARLFPPLGEVRVRVVPLWEERGLSLVRIAETQIMVAVSPGDLCHHQDQVWVLGRLTERISQPGQWFGKRYYGEVVINGVTALVPVGLDCRNLRVA